jgi:MFS family permease
MGSDPISPPRRVALVMLAAHILSMAGFSTFAALLPELRALWHLSNSEAGAVSGMFFVGYAASVSYWTALTDRVDGRRVYLAGALLAAAGSVGFGLMARGFASAVLFQVLLGTGVAAMYMPGLRLLSDRVSGASQSRYIAFYTSFFGIGTALSLAAAGAVSTLAGWQWAFVAAAGGPLGAGALVFAGIGARAPAAANARAPFSLATLFPLAAWRRLLAIRPVAGFALGYAAHCLELFGSRSWMVAFLAFSAGLHAGGAGFPWNLAVIAAFINVCAVPASILGNELALRIGRRRWISIAMLGSGASGMLLAGAAGWHWIAVLAVLLVYSMLVMAESATLTAGMVAAAPEQMRGTAMGLYSLMGFAGGMIGPVVFGAALDAAGGATRSAAWLASYAAIGAGCLASSFVAWRRGRG